jgi:hypothetical protein
MTSQLILILPTTIWVQGNSETTVVVLITPPPVDEVGRRVYARSATVYFHAFCG